MAVAYFFLGVGLSLAFPSKPERTVMAPSVCAVRRGPQLRQEVRGSAPLIGMSVRADLESLTRFRVLAARRRWRLVTVRG